MKQESAYHHIQSGISNIFDYSPFGAPLDGRTIQNTFYQASTSVDTVKQTVYALEETFDVASDWQATTSYSQITYPSGKMRVRNSSTVKRTIGAKKNFVTGEGLHEVSFDITSLPSLICEYQPPFPPIGIGINSDSTTTTSGIGGNATLNVVVKNQNSVTITSGSYTTTGTFTNINFTAVEGDTYTLEFYINNACKNTFFQVDNVFISYEEVIITQTVYALEETFDVASDWQATTSYSQITYPSGKMRVRNSSTVKRTIGAKKSFVTGEGLHEVSFDITSLPSPICSIIRPPIIRSNSDSTTTTSGIGGNATLNVVVKNQNSVTITSGSYTTTGNFTNINFTAVEGDTYTIEFYINNACKNTFFQVDNVFISHKEEVNIEAGSFIVSGDYRYGFNSMEKDDEIKGQGNSYTTEFRQYDPRVGRWLSLDPLMAKYPNQSPYAAFNNNPIYFIDPDGKDGIASVNQEDTAIMIRAVYFIEISPYGDGFSMDNYKQIMGINEALNQQAYKVTDPNSQYYGYNIKFDLQFERVISKEKARTFAENEKTLQGNGNFDLIVGGFPIGNSLIMMCDDLFNGISEIIETAKEHNVTVNQVLGMTDVTFQHIAIPERSVNNILAIIHEVFHTLYFNKDGAEGGIGAGTELPTSEEINELIKGFEQNERIVNE